MTINVQHGSDVVPEKVHWLWRPYIPFGMLTTIVGDPGAGKTWLACKLSADLSRGDPLPGHEVPYKPLKVLFATADDSIKYTIAPRMLSLGANMENIYYIEDPITLDRKGLTELEAVVSQFAVSFIVIDPIIGFFGDGSKDMNKGTDVRPILSGLKGIAERSGSAVIAIRHMRKASADTKGPAIYKGSGSIDFVGSARSEIHVEVAPSGPGTAIMRHVKTNIGPMGRIKAYEFTGNDDAPVGQGHEFRWLADETAQLVVKKAEPRKDQAKEFILDVLRAGPIPALLVYQRGEEEGFSVKTLKEAKRGIAESVKDGNGGWTWRLI